MNDNVFRGEIYYIYPGEYCGSEQKGGRPGIVISNDVNNKHSRCVEVVFLTTREKSPLPTHVSVQGTGRLSTALCEQVHTVDKCRIGSYAGELNSTELKGVERAVSIGIGLNLSLNCEKAVKAWGEMIENDPDAMNWKNSKAADVPPACSQDRSNEKPKEDDPEASKNENDSDYLKLRLERDMYQGLYESLLRTVQENILNYPKM